MRDDTEIRRPFIEYDGPDTFVGLSVDREDPIMIIGDRESVGVVTKDAPMRGVQGEFETMRDDTEIRRTFIEYDVPDSLVGLSVDREIPIMIINGGEPVGVVTRDARSRGAQGEV